MSLLTDAQTIMQNALKAAQPDEAVRKALGEIDLSGKRRVLLVAVGKAAWQMSKAALVLLGKRVDGGVVITKHGHSMGPLSPLQVFEAGHPVPDEDTLAATRAALRLVEGVTEEDAVLLLVSGGGSALFEDAKVPLDALQDTTRQMLAAGCDIVEINTVRKRLSNVKGGRFALRCAPAHVYAIILSDIIGDPLDMIASGPAYPDSSTREDALRIVERYHLQLPQQALDALEEETPKELPNVTSMVTGSVTQLCLSAAETARQLGYTPHILTASLRCQAREAGSFLASMAEYHQDSPHSLAYILGGETVVQLKGKGKGGRNQEIALSAVPILASCRNTCIFSLGSDGTDGPPDAAGGYADEHTLQKMKEVGVDPLAALEDNDAYPALRQVDGLIMTGPTGTNVNDLTMLLIKR